MFTKIAQDGICIITNPKNPVSNLSQETVAGIFTGTIRDWSQVPGANVSGPIDLFDRDGASGTQDAFQHIFLGETLKISPSASAENSNGLEQNAVSGDEHAIGFVSFAFTAGVNAVGYQGIPCTLRNAKSGQYGGVRNFWMVTKGTPKGEAAEVHQLGHQAGNKTVERSSTRAGSPSTSRQPVPVRQLHDRRPATPAASAPPRGEDRPARRAYARRAGRVRCSR